MRALIVAVVLGCAALSPTGALAQAGTVDEPQAEEDAAEETPAEERATQFVGVRGADAERIPGGALLLGAYAIVWVLLLIYLFRMRRLQRQTADELERLSAEIRASGGR